MARNTSSTTRALDLGQLQTQVESTSRTLKAANTTLAKAKEAQHRAEAEYHAVQKSMAAAVEQLTQATRVL